MQTLLELKGISRRVSDRFSLRDVAVAVEPGQIVGFVGANGAGKTTTIRAALGLIQLDAGGSVEKVGVAPDPKRVGPASWNLEYG